MVLGLSASSRIIGIAVLDRHGIVEYAVGLHTEAWSQAKARKRMAYIQRFIDQYPITSIALYIPYEHYKTPKTAATLKQIIAHCTKKGIPVSRYEAGTLNALCEVARAKKKALMRALVQQYPDLRHVHRKELRNKNKYYHKLFEAVGVATLLESSL